LARFEQALNGTRGRGAGSGPGSHQIIPANVRVHVEPSPLDQRKNGM
jgi:hypothetical protein